LAGGYPPIATRQTGARRKAWFQSYLMTILQRDVRDLANIADLTAVPCPSLDRDLLQFPGGHKHQSTKVSRRHQWENGATAGTLAPDLAVSEQSS
jgi:hypothetical protein